MTTALLRSRGRTFTSLHRNVIDIKRIRNIKGGENLEDFSVDVHDFGKKGRKLTSEVLGGMWSPRGNKKGLSR